MEKKKIKELVVELVRQSKTNAQIISAMEQLGVSISERTIRRYLDEVDIQRENSIVNKTSEVDKTSGADNLNVGTVVANAIIKNGNEDIYVITERDTGSTVMIGNTSDVVSKLNIKDETMEYISNNVKKYKTYGYSKYYFTLDIGSKTQMNSATIDSMSIEIAQLKEKVKYMMQILEDNKLI
jgi:IS30 family transposase